MNSALDVEKKHGTDNLIDMESLIKGEEKAKKD